MNWSGITGFPCLKLAIIQCIADGTFRTIKTYPFATNGLTSVFLLWENFFETNGVTAGFLRENYSLEKCTFYKHMVTKFDIYVLL